jgi:hypothetical protein
MSRTGRLPRQVPVAKVAAVQRAPKPAIPPKVPSRWDYIPRFPRERVVPRAHEALRSSASVPCSSLFADA